MRRFTHTVLGSASMAVALLISQTSTLTAQDSIQASAAALSTRICAIASTFESQSRIAGSLAQMESTQKLWWDAAKAVVDFQRDLVVSTLTSAQKSQVQTSLKEMEACTKRVQRVLPEWQKRVDEIINLNTSGNIDSPEQRRHQEKMKNEKELRELADSIMRNIVGVRATLERVK